MFDDTEQVASFRRQTPVTPSDATDLTGLATKGLFVGPAADGSDGLLVVECVADGGNAVSYTWPKNTWFPGNVKRVRATTTCTRIVAWA